MRYIVLLKAQQLADPPPGTVRSDHEARRGGDRGRRADRQRRAGPGRHRRPGPARSRGGLSVTDGPFAEAKEFISYAQYEVRSKEEAVEWASRS